MHPFNVFSSSCPCYSATLHNKHNDHEQEFIIKYWLMSGHQKWQSANMVMVILQNITINSSQDDEMNKHGVKNHKCL